MNGVNEQSRWAAVRSYGLTFLCSLIVSPIAFELSHGQVRELDLAPERTSFSGVWWAYASYAALAVAVIFLVARMRARRAKTLDESQLHVAESEERLRLALWGSGDELWDWDLVTGVVHRMNPLLELDRPIDERYTSVRNIAKYIHPQDYPALENSLETHLRGESPSYDVAYRRRNLDGGWTWILERGQVVARDTQGRAVRVSGTSKNIGSLKQAERALKDLNDELETRVHQRTRALEKTNENLRSTQQQLVESEKMASLGSLVAGVAHELNTPIGIGLTAASHLKTCMRDMREKLTQIDRGDSQGNFAQCDEAIDLILSSLERTAAMVRSFKQVAVDQTLEEKREFRLHAYLEHILMSLRSQVRKNGHRFEVSCADDIVLASYPGMFYQLITNLVLNSIHHGYQPGEPGRLEIAATLDPKGTLSLTYRDDGCGMSKDVQSRMYEPFFTTRRDNGGTGLGMHIVYNVVTQGLKGEIRCTSTPGRGVQFEISVPDASPRDGTGESTDEKDS